MAILQDTANGGAVRCLFNKPPTPGLAPMGTWRAKLIDIVDKFGVERRKYDNPAEMEKVDLTQFRFGFRDRSGTPWTIDTRPMKISGNEKSALYATLKSILGQAPRMGWDYMALKGTDVLITIEHNEGKVTSYAAIAAISPLPADLGTAPAAPAAAPAPATGAPPPAPAEPSVEDAGDDPLPF